MPDGAAPRDETFGCEGCCPEDAEAAWNARAGFREVSSLVEESHWGVDISACPACHQRFVEVFAERIDWVGGHDPQAWIVVPLTDLEAARLARRGAGVTDGDVERLGDGRRWLWRDFPGDGAPQTRWMTGAILIAPHD